MESIVGIFNSLDAAEQSLEDLVRRDMPRQSMVLLSKEASEKSGAEISPEHRLEKLADPGAGADGSGKASGGTLGATLGGTAGFAAGATAATLMVPGLGAIFAIGLGAAALLGLGGAAAGAKFGDTLDAEVDSGVDKEKEEFYQELLRRGKSLVIANVRSGSDASTVHEVFVKRGSEDAEKARRELGRAA
ncbi:MAG: hypothetical protein WBX38_20400 [Candidatus Sulfotelmatobacter sp.]